MSTLACETWVAWTLCTVALLSMARVVYRRRRTEPAQRARVWRFGVLLLAQPVCAALLYLALLPPTTPGEAGTLVVATAGASPADWAAGQGGDVRVALPEAPSLPGIERVPDLATALRRHPGMQRVRVIGAGLEARDREAARGRALSYAPDALPRGLVELDAPDHAAAGGAFAITGRAQALQGGFVELLDPGRQRVDRAPLSRDGRFRLNASTRVAGAAIYTLRLRDAGQRVIEDVAVPMQVDTAQAPRILLMAGAPNPEVKYLRRWARDAGLAMRTQIATGGGMQVGDAPIALSAANLAKFDVVVLDERAWAALGDAQRAALVDGVRGGLGVLLRVTAALSDTERRRLRAWGFDVGAGRESDTIRLAQRTHDDDALRARIGPGTRDAPRRQDDVPPAIPALTRRTLAIATTDGVPLLREEHGTPVAVWRAEGRGRIAVWTVTDTYRLVLAGRDDVHGETWSDAIATLARPQAARPFTIEGERRVGERIALCAVGANARVAAPDGAITDVRVDPATGVRACAAYWPREPGWHRVESGGRSALFHARAADEAQGLHANAMRDATMRLTADAHAMTAANASLAVPRHPGARWPWWLAWLLVSASVWWLERSRVGV